MDENTEVTATADAPVSDRFEVETNIVPPSAEPEVVEPVKDKTVESDPSEKEPDEEPTEKAINPRTLARKAEKERLIRTAEEKTRLAEESMRRAAELEEKLKQYEQPKPKQRDISKEPDINDYEDFMEYNRAVARYDAAQLYKEESSKLEMQKLESAFDKRAEAVRAEKPDFDEKVVSLVQSQLLTPDINKAILSSELSAEVSYHLAEHGNDLMILRGLPQSALPDAIKTIESFIRNGGDKQEKPRVTQAAPPIAPPSGMARTNRSISSYTQEEIENMPLSEYNKIFVKR